MPGIMTLDAEVAVYPTTNQYWVGDSAWLGATQPIGTAKSCGPAELNRCEQELGQQIWICNARNCDALCNAFPPSPLCAGCLENRDTCVESKRRDYADCGICTAGTTCRPDLTLAGPAAGYSYCCGGNLLPCNGNCVSTSCGAREQFSQVSCRCECASPYVSGPNGGCVCPPVACPPHLPIVDANCQCGPCPAPLTAVNGNCVNLQSDPNNCGMPGRVCGPGEGCCSGTCVSLNSNGRCGTCALSCAGANHVCCPGGIGGKGGGCRNLAIDPNNCGACGNECPPYIGMICANGQCGCSAPHTPCGEGCCGPGWVCLTNPGAKGSHCLCPVGRDTCGLSDETCCPTGTTCCGGITCCPTGRICCGANCCPTGQTCCAGQCCPSGQVCCGNKCCSAGQVCCDGVCTTLGTPQDCDSCGDACLFGWSAPAVYGRCDLLHHCRCPAGWVATHWNASGDDDFCCPAAYPNPCKDGVTCNDVPC